MDIKMSFMPSKIAPNKSKKELVMEKENFYVDSELYKLTTLWTLRAIFDLGGERELLRSRCDDVLEFLGIESKEPKEEDIQGLKNRLEILEKSQKQTLQSQEPANQQPAFSANDRPCLRPDQALSA